MNVAGIEQQWQALPVARQRLLLMGWSLVALMLLYVLVRPLYGSWQDARAWQRLAQQAQALPAVTTMSADDWAALGQASGVLLSEISATERGWQLAGHTSRIGALSTLFERAATQGWQGSSWQVQRSADGLTFRLALLPVAEVVQP
jgi:type II secretion system protein M (XcpZ-type)